MAKLLEQEVTTLFDTKNGKHYKKYQRSWKSSGKSLKSLKSYQSYFLHFLKFLHENYDDIDLYSDEFQEECVDILEDFMDYSREKDDCGKKNINNRLAAISSFFVWSVKRRILDNHPFAGKLDRVKGAQDEVLRKSQFLNREQIDKVKRELAINDDYDMQDQVLFSLVMDSGNRVGAVDQFNLSNLDMESMTFSDIVEKGNNTVEAVFDEESKDLLQEWLDMRKEEFDNMEVDAIFITNYGGKWSKMSYGSLQYRFSRIGKNILGLERFGMHDGRKTCGNLVYEETGDLTMAQEILNHKSPEVTSRHYIKKKAKSSLRDEIKKKKAEKKKED